MTSLNFVVDTIEALTIADLPERAGMDRMSPYVWHENDAWHMLTRAVPRPLGPTDPTGLILSGRSDDGIAFTIDAAPAIAPGSVEEDAGGCEDPTVVMAPGGGYLVYFTGVDAARAHGSLLLAAGPSLDRLERKAVMLQAPKDEGNIKEATLAQAADGSWRLFYEYARDNASRIGVARGEAPTGPWTSLPDPFTIRDDAFDRWHLSTGPMVALPDGGQAMFYNGATQDARWRIGWIAFDPTLTQVTARCIQPLIVPPPDIDRTATDIAFAASVVVERDTIWLYYSLEDRLLARAAIRRV